MRDWREDRVLALAARSDTAVKTRENTWALALPNGRTVIWHRPPTAAEVRQARASIGNGRPAAPRRSAPRLSVAEAARLARRDAR